MHARSTGQAGSPIWSMVVGGGLVLALAAAVLVVGAGLGYRIGVLELGSSFTMLRVGAYVGLAAGVVSLAGAGVSMVRRRHIRDLVAGVLGIAIGAVCYALPARQQAIAREVPTIHDITTDTDDPPAFVAVLPLRADAPNTAEYDPQAAPQQREAYPDLGPITLEAPPAEGFARALAAVRDMGWELVDEDAATGRIEATDTTFWFGFKDDVVVRVRPAGGGSRIDVRSVSRVGLSDVGANAKRIREYASRVADN